VFFFIEERQVEVAEGYRDYFRAQFPSARRERLGQPLSYGRTEGPGAGRARQHENLNRFVDMETNDMR
jgi:hypothetical protein